MSIVYCLLGAWAGLITPLFVWYVYSLANGLLDAEAVSEDEYR